MLVKTIQLYEDRRDVTLTTYVLDDSPEMLDGKKRPAVLVCPGGGYLFNSDREAEPIALRFAAMGYHAFVLRYSIFNDGAPRFTPEDRGWTANPNSMFPGPMRDIGAAFLAIHAYAEDWLVDTDRIALCGFSAGAHNCAMYLNSWHKPVITGYFGAPVDRFKPAAAVMAYGVFDLRLQFEIRSDPPGLESDDKMLFAYLGTRSPSRELLETTSPVLHVSGHTPPVFLWTTGEDGLVPVEHTIRYATALAQAGVPFEVHIFENGQHGLGLADQATSGGLNEIDADAAKWMGLADSWLKKRFALPLPEIPHWMQLNN